MSLTAKYFPTLSPQQIAQFEQMENLYSDWNSMINVVSRKDIDNLAMHHILHSLAIAKVIGFKPGSCIMDAGTGGGFPGIPLAVMFPECSFTLVDSIGKKIMVINTIVSELKLTNVTTFNSRFEAIRGSFDFVTGRAVSALPLFVSMVKDRIKIREINDRPNGVFYLIGGDFDNDLRIICGESDTWNLSDFFSENYFATKKLVHIYHFS